MYYSILTAFALLLAGCKNDAPPVTPQPPSGKPYQRPEVLTDELTSEYVGDDYPLQIYLPADYAVATDSLPVIYILDGTSRFNVMVELVVELNIKCIVVGVGNNEMRDRDYMPVNTCASGGGGHLNFYSFIVRELVPYIDATYRTDRRNRTLAGHSFSGAMALIALFADNPEEPVINSYIANDPSILCAPPFFFHLLPAANSNSLSPSIKLHISKSYQNTLELYMFATTLESKNYTWLNLDWQEFTAENHDTILKPSFRAGLEFIFNK